MQRIVVSRWELEGYYCNTSEIDTTLKEVSSLCNRLEVEPPELEEEIHTWGMRYQIIAPVEITYHFSGVWRNDFEPVSTEFDCDASADCFC